MVKVKTKKQTQGKLRKKGLPWFIWLAIVLGIVGIVVGIRTCPASKPAAPIQSGELDAAIIDQLYTFQSNQDFIQQTTQELEDYGFNADVYRVDEVTVDLYRQLPTYGYELIIFRAHSGILQRGEGTHLETTDATCLFTDEAYSKNKYVLQQLTDQILEARIAEGYPHVFAINSRFILQSMEGEFQNTVIIMMGCSTTEISDMAEAFVLKGASTYIGWDAAVDLGYVDKAALLLIKNLCVENLSVEEAIAETMAQEGPDPSTGAKLKYYPPESGDQTIQELIGWENPD